MADFNPQERVKKMVLAIKNEAKEKSESIMDNAAQQFKIEKNKLINQQKERIIEEFKKNLESYSIQKRIQRSSKINQSRLQKMQVRFELINKLKDDIKQRLFETIQDQHKYSDMMKQLIIQCMIKLMEPKVEMKCLEQDLKLVESIIQDCEHDFTALFKAQTGKELKTQITINRDHYLGVEGKSCLGGVVLTCNGGRTVCSNTLDERIELAFQEFLPDIRAGLFPERK